MERKKMKFDKLSNKIIGSAIEVHNYLGPGFTERIYQKALMEELMLKKIEFESEKNVTIYYKGKNIGDYRIDLVIDNKIILELKAVEDIAKIHKAQLKSYLKATGKNIGLIINFSKVSLDVKRIVHNLKPDQLIRSD